MDVLVTGASGYIGKEVAKKFAQEGYRVYGSIRSEKASSELLQNEVIPIVGPLDKLPEKVLEAKVFIHCIGGEKEENLNAVKTLLAHQPEIFLYTSGVWVYGNSKKSIDEESPLSPLPNVTWRAEVEKLVLNHPGSIVIRPSHVYGYRQALLGKFFDAATKNALFVPGNGENSWSIVHVQDLANLYYLSVQKGKFQTIFNAAEDQSIPLKVLIDAISQKTKAAAHYLPIEEAVKKMGPIAYGLAVDQPHISNKKAKTFLNWKPSHHLLQDFDLQWSAWKAFQKP